MCYDYPPECHKYLEVFVRGELQANDDEACRAPNPGRIHNTEEGEVCVCDGIRRLAACSPPEHVYLSTVTRYSSPILE